MSTHILIPRRRLSASELLNAERALGCAGNCEQGRKPCDCGPDADLLLSSGAMEGPYRAPRPARSGRIARALRDLAECLLSSKPPRLF